MTRNTAVFLLLALAMMIGARSGSAAPSTDQQVKSLGQRYNQIEDQLARSVYYIKKETSGAETTIEQAWFNGAGDLIKVAVEHDDASGRELTEYVALDFDNAYDGMFVFTRKEAPLPDGGTQVDESRKYFAWSETTNGDLIRELRKNARFKAGETLDTARIPNAVVDLSKLPKETPGDAERSRARGQIFSKPEQIAAELRKTGPPEVDPFASVKGDSEKFRVIHGTVSPDGRYAIAIGFARSEIDWDGVRDTDYQDEKITYTAEDDEDLRNYVVDLASQKILGETGCNYFGTRRRYNHRECVMSWSPDCATFVQLWVNKWNHEGCYAGRIAPGPTLVGMVDLGQAAGRKAVAALKKHRDEDSGEGLSIDVQQVSNDGVVDMDVYSVNPVVPHRGETMFSFHERMRLRVTPAGLRAELLAIKRNPTTD